MPITMLDNALLGQSFMQQLMLFRTSYLRAVGRAAVNLTFRQALVADPLTVLKDSFGYDCPWYLNLQLLDDWRLGPRMNPSNGSVMTLPYWGEAITIYIPNNPGGDSQSKLDALTAYYNENPWFLRPKEESTNVKAVAKTIAVADRDPPPIHAGKWQSVGSDSAVNARYDLGVAFEHFTALGAVMFSALSLAWQNDLFMSELTKYDGLKGERKTTINLLFEWLEYTYPFDVDLIVQKDPTATYDAATGKWKNTTPPTLLLSLPYMTGAEGVDAPAKEVAGNNQNPAFAMTGVTLYNTDGPGYPFTCG